MMGGGQAQLYEMVRHGLSFVADPKQMVFTNDEQLTVQGVIDGLFEIGMARTDQIERHVDMNTGAPIDTRMFKIINAQTHSLEDGRLFPFKSSTSLHPEWPVTSLDHVQTDVAAAVQEALLAIGDHAMALEYGENLLCETTPETAELAMQSKNAGMLSGFRPARNYFSVRTKQETAGFLNEDENGNLHCIRGETLYDDIKCPDEYYMVPRNEFNSTCSVMGMECPKDYQCYCKPCVHRSVAVDVFEVKENVIVDATPCEKMSVCGTVEQTKLITFRIVDHMHRTGVAVTVMERMQEDEKALPVYAVEGQNWTYEFNMIDNKIGMAIVEIAFDNIQVSNKCTYTHGLSFIRYTHARRRHC